MARKLSQCARGLVKERGVIMDNEISIAFKKCFSDYYCKVVLDYLRKITIERVLGVSATEAELRSLEAQRALVKLIQNKVDCECKE